MTKSILYFGFQSSLPYLMCSLLTTSTPFAYGNNVSPFFYSTILIKLLAISALDTLARVLGLFGAMFSPKLWEMIFRGVLLPIFNNIGYSKGRVRFPEEVRHSLHYFHMINANQKFQSQDWLTTTCPHAFRLLMDIFTSFVETIDFLSGEILQLLSSCVLQGSICFIFESFLRLFFFRNSRKWGAITAWGTNSPSLYYCQWKQIHWASKYIYITQKLLILIILFIKVWDLVTAKIDQIVTQLTGEQFDILLSLLNNPPTIVTPIAPPTTNITISAPVCFLLFL